MKRGFFAAYRNVLLVGLLITAVYTVLTLLYGMPLDGIVYGAVLSAAVMGVVLAITYVRWKARVLEIEHLMGCIREDALPLPEAGDRLERAYDDMLNALCRDRAQRTADEMHRQKRVMDDFTLWAHQIKTPIAALRLLLQSPEKAREGEMEAELTRIERYVEMALSYLRLSGDSRDLVVKRQPLAPIVRGEVRRLARLFILRRQTPVIDIGTVEVLTDGKWLAFALEQLLTNAIKYSPEGAEVRISCEDSILVVEDHGCGIPAQDLPRIFERGYTGENGRDNGRATGLGLYLCKQAMELLGHEITVESKVGVGTKAKIRLCSAERVFE